MHPERLRENAERELFAALERVSAQAEPLLESGDFAGYLKQFAALRAPVDSFFDGVMVMAEDSALRHNRLALLAELNRGMNRFADLAKLAT